MSTPLYLTAHLGPYQSALDVAQRDLTDRRIVPRIWSHDHTVWHPDPAQIANRLGWLHAAENMTAHVPRLDALFQAVRAAGYTDVLLLGMGGSSLAPEVFSIVFGAQPGHPRLAVLDSTDPGAVLAYADRLDPARTL
ncbi:MAG: transaldolase, partial [Chloroflexi bacterium]|nr:transaldolase [Chloroflexota bacterium]